VGIAFITTTAIIIQNRKSKTNTDSNNNSNDDSNDDSNQSDSNQSDSNQSDSNQIDSNSIDNEPERITDTEILDAPILNRIRLRSDSKVRDTELENESESRHSNTIIEQLPEIYNKNKKDEDDLIETATIQINFEELNEIKKLLHESGKGFKVISSFSKRV
jgi:hypothetical protein